MHIGIYPSLSGSSGGVYQYSLTMLQALRDWPNKADRFTVFVKDGDHPILNSLRAHGWTVQPIRPQQPASQKAIKRMRSLLGEGLHRDTWRWLRERVEARNASGNQKDTETKLNRVKSKPEMTRWLQSNRIELMIYPKPDPTSFEARIPYVIAVHDLQHRLQPEFPEVTADGNWERREYMFRNATRNAALVLADSEVGKEDILNFYGQYGVSTERVKVLPFLPASYLAVDIPEAERQRVRIQYQLPELYIFYPGEFWPHKNHAQLIRSLGWLKRMYGLEIPIVLCGAYSDELRRMTFNEMMSIAQRLGVEGQVHYLGFVPDNDMSGLYAEATALVMPTFFGPTNIPPLEAWSYGCPVLTSDIRGIRQQMGEAALLVDPRSTESIAAGIRKLWTDKELRATLARRGAQRLASYSANDFKQRLQVIIEEAKERARTPQLHFNPNSYSRNMDIHNEERGLIATREL